jgi:hypothetical protein
MGVGGVMLLLALLVGSVVGVGAARGVQWYWYAPHWWVARDMGSKNVGTLVAGYEEASRRVLEPGRKPGGLGPIVEALLAAQGRKDLGVGVVGRGATQWGAAGAGGVAVPGRYGVLRLLDACVGAGDLSPAQLAKYESQLLIGVDLELSGASRRRVGLAAPMRVRIASPRTDIGRYRVEFEGTAKRIDGGARVEWARPSSAGESIRLRNEAYTVSVPLDLGAYDKPAGGELSMTVEVAGELRLMKNDTVLQTVPVMKRHTVTWDEKWDVTMVAGGGSRPVIDALTVAMQSAVLNLDVTRQPGTIARQEVLWYAQRPLWSAGFVLPGDVYLRSGGREWHLDAVVEGAGSRSSARGAPPEMVLGNEATVVIRSNPLVAEVVGAGKPAWEGRVRMVMPVNRRSGAGGAQQQAAAPTAVEISPGGGLDLRSVEQLAEGLRADDDGVRNDAVWEVLRRLWQIELAAGKTPESEQADAVKALAPLVDVLLDVQGKQEWAWNPQVGDALDLLLLRGVMGEAQGARYVLQAAGRDGVIVRTADTPRGRDLPLEVEQRWPRLGRIVPRRVVAKLEVKAGSYTHVVFDSSLLAARLESNSSRHLYLTTLGVHGSTPAANEQMRMARELQLTLSYGMLDGSGRRLGESAVTWTHEMKRAEPQEAERASDDGARKPKTP